MKATRIDLSRIRAWLALTVSVAFAVAAISAQTTPHQGFPVLPRIANADPAMRHEIVVKIPTKFKVVRSTDMLTISFSVESPRILKFTVGQNMATGFGTDLHVYPVGTKRPSQSNGRGVQSSSLTDISDFGSTASILNASRVGIPMPGKKYIVEEEITIFETDIPAQHMWAPKGSPNYKVLWQGVVKGVVN